MRIAIFSEVYWPMVSGVSLTLQRAVQAMEQRGHTVRVYAPAYDLPVGVSDLPHVHRSPGRRLFLYPDVQWAFPRGEALAEDVARFRPDVIHVATEFAMGVAGANLARQFDVPMIASAHTDYERYASRYRVDWLLGAGWHYLRWFYQRSARVLAPSRVYERHLHSRNVKHTGLWSRGVDLAAFSPAHRSNALRASWGIPDDAPLVLYVGRIAAEKNLHLLLDAWQRMGSARGNAHLVMVGQGPLVESIAGANHPNVHLAGQLTGPALGAAYASADCFAFPSSTETFGNVLLEAMASGLPSLAAGAGGVLDFAQHEENALLVAPDDANAIVGGLQRLLWDPSLRERLARAAVGTARARDWDSVFDGLASDYRIVAERALPLAA